MFYYSKIYLCASCFLLSELDAGAVGLALSYAITLMGMFQWGVRQSAEVENMVSYSYHLIFIKGLYLNDIYRIHDIYCCDWAQCLDS